MNEAYLVPSINRDNSTVRSNPDVLSGFKASAKNGQTRLATDYLVYVIDILVQKVEVLEARLAEIDTHTTPKVVAKSSKVTAQEEV